MSERVFLISFYMQIAQLHNIFLKSQGISTDSREDLKDKIFVALKGENFDGNQYVQNALEKGALLAIADNPELKNLSQHIIVVNDSLTTLQKLANFHRRFLNIPIISITGSNGKTTTKELIAKVMEKKFAVHYTFGNLNNHIGVPLTLLKMNTNTQIGVVEMGANHPGEIKALCKIAEPDYGYITNFGKAHLEGFGSFEGVIKAKSELYDYLKANNKIIFINEDQELQLKQGKDAKTIGFSQNKDSFCTVKLKNTIPFVEVQYQNLPIQSHLLGEYNFSNIAAAICIGQFFEIEKEQIKEAIEHYRPDNNRSQMISKGSNQIILDAYNANPTSMEAAILNFQNLPAENKAVIVGDMFEVGKTENQEHQYIVDLLEKSDIKDIFVCGKIFYRTNVDRAQKFSSFEDLQKKIKALSYKNTCFLIKGSRGMAMERILEVL